MANAVDLLSRALVRHSTARFKSLLKKHPELVNAVDVQYGSITFSPGYTALQAVLKAGGRLDLAEALLDAGADINGRAEADGWTPLMVAARGGDLDAVRWLLERGARVSDRSGGWGALFWAVTSGHEAVARLLVEHGAEVHAVSDAPREVMWPACERGYDWLVELCLAAGASPFALDNLLRMPIELAAEGGHLPLVERLMSEKGLTAKRRNAIFHRAVGSRNRALIQHMLADGRGLRSKDEAGRTLLHTACEMDLEWLVRALLDAGLDPNAKDAHGNPPLTSAARTSVALVEMLLERGAKVNRPNGSGWTALHQATESGREEIVALLLERGALANANDAHWGNALHVALLSETHSATKTTKLVRLLLAYGADPNAKNGYGDAALDQAPPRTKLGRMMRAALE